MTKKRNKYTYFPVGELPERAQEALAHYRAAFNNTGQLTVTNVQKNCIFIQIHGPINTRHIERLVRVTYGFHTEIKATAPNYLEIRFFFPSKPENSNLLDFDNWISAQEIRTQPAENQNIRIRIGNFIRQLGLFDETNHK